MRIEFFGDEIDRIRCMVSSTGRPSATRTASKSFPPRTGTHRRGRPQHACGAHRASR
ncbi:MAG: hypothetical protein ACLU0O_08910 [Collinsella sp.]